MNRLAEAEALREKIKKLEQELESAKKDLAAIERTCPHQWPRKPEYVPEHIPGYHIAGDPPGTMGVDRQLPMDVPPQTIKRWQRRCLLCGKVEITTRIKEEKTEKPVFY